MRGRSTRAAGGAGWPAEAGKLRGFRARPGQRRKGKWVGGAVRWLARSRRLAVPPATVVRTACGRRGSGKEGMSGACGRGRGGRGRHGGRAAGQRGGEIGFQISGISEVAVVKCRLTTDSVAATCKPGLQVEMSAARVAPTVKLFKIAVFVKLHPAAGKPGLPTATASRTGEYAMTNYSLNRYQSDCWKVSERVCCVTPRRASPHPGSFTSSQRPSMCRTIVPVVE